MLIERLSQIIQRIPLEVVKSKENKDEINVAENEIFEKDQAAEEVIETKLEPPTVAINKVKGFRERVKKNLSVELARFKRKEPAVVNESASEEVIVLTGSDTEVEANSNSENKLKTFIDKTKKNLVIKLPSVKSREAQVEYEVISEEPVVEEKENKKFGKFLIARSKPKMEKTNEVDILATPVKSSKFAFKDSSQTSKYSENLKYKNLLAEKKHQLELEKLKMKKLELKIKQRKHLSLSKNSIAYKFLVFSIALVICAVTITIATKQIVNIFRVEPKSAESIVIVPEVKEADEGKDLAE